jgi:hypothetical protein
MMAAAFRYRDQINPLVRIAAKTKVGAAETDKIALVVLTALDAAKRGAAPASLANTLTEHLMVGILLWARQGNRALYDTATAAWLALCKACARPTDLLDLTTSEYAAIRKAVGYYLRAIPQLEAGILVGAFLEAQNKLKG